MDPNALSNLDPKLRETYERVMGTPTPASSAPTPPAPPTPTDPISTTQNVTIPQQPVSPVMQTPFASEQKPEAVTISQPLPAAPMTPLATPHSHAGLIKILYVLGAIVFFVIYVFFWARIFNFQLPFIG